MLCCWTQAPTVAVGLLCINSQIIGAPQFPTGRVGLRCTPSVIFNFRPSQERLPQTRLCFLLGTVVCVFGLNIEADVNPLIAFLSFSRA